MNDKPPPFVRWYQGPERGPNASGVECWKFLAVGNGRTVAITMPDDPGHPHVCLYFREYTDAANLPLPADHCFQYAWPARKLHPRQLGAIAAYYLTADIDKHIAAVEDKSRN